MNTNILSLLRFLAVIIVILFHQRGSSEFLKVAPKTLTAGQQMVTFFFVLSGFGLVLAYYKKTLFSYKEYWEKRATRIIPLYLLALVSLIILTIMARSRLDIFATILHLSFLQSWFPSYTFSINAPAWFISDLFFFYATFPLTLSYIKISNPNPKLFLSLALLLWLVTQIILTTMFNSSLYHGFPSNFNNLIFYFPPSHYCSFFLGVATGYLFIKRKEGCLPKIKSIYFILISCFLVILFIENELLINQVIKLKLPFGASFYAPLFMLVILSLSISDSLFANFFASKPVIILGEISFSIYILQVPVYDITENILKNHLHIVSYDFRLSIYIFTLLIIGVFLNYAVEKPIRAALNNRINYYSSN